MADLTVLDLSQDLAGAYCGRLFAGMGATVLKIEPPSGDPMRSVGPFPEGKTDATGALFLHLNTGKQDITLDIESPQGRELLVCLVARADVLIESFQPGRMAELSLGYDQLKAANPRLVMTSISAFGQTGPYRDFRATEIGLHAVSGEMYVAGLPPQPLKKGGNVAQYLGGLNGFIGSMGALFLRQATGEGQHIDVSLTESIASIAGQALREQAASDYIPGRRERGLGWPIDVYPCKDGYMMTFTAYGVGDVWWPPFAEMITSDKPRVIPAASPKDETDQQVWDELFRSWLSRRTRKEAHREAQQRGLAFGYVATAEDVLQSPQLEHRGFLKRDGENTLMNLPFLLDGKRLPMQPAPALGQHNQDVYCGLLGLQQSDLDNLQKSGVI